METNPKFWGLTGLGVKELLMSDLLLFQFIAIFALLAVAAAVPVADIKGVELEAPAEYEFSYSVRDDHTGDVKSQQESRKGDDVKGSYSLIDADGYQRIVEYTADEHNGFNAVVRREPIKGYVAPKAIVAAPVAKIAYAVPKFAYTAPVFHKAVYAAPKLVAAAPAGQATVKISAHGIDTVY